MVLEPRSSRPVLQRRSNVSNAVQAGLDGIAVTGVAWYLIYEQFGYITSDYVIMLLLLIGALAVIYDHYAIYRTNVGLTVKAFRLFWAWSATFCFLVVMAFLPNRANRIRGCWSGAVRHRLFRPAVPAHCRARSAEALHGPCVPHGKRADHRQR
jgi:hypothetical protein